MTTPRSSPRRASNGPAPRATSSRPRVALKRRPSWLPPGRRCESQGAVRRGALLRRRVGDQRLVANSLLNLARAELRSGKVERANRCSNRAWAWPGSRDTWAARLRFSTSGGLQLHDGENERACEAFEEALAIAQIRGDKRVTRRACRARARGWRTLPRGARSGAAGAALLESSW